jgi:hypothetical protein
MQTYNRFPHWRAVAAGRERSIRGVPAAVQACGAGADQVGRVKRRCRMCLLHASAPPRLFFPAYPSLPCAPMLPCCSLVTRSLDICLLVLMAYLPYGTPLDRRVLVAVHLARAAVANATRPLMRSGKAGCGWVFDTWRSWVALP